MATASASGRCWAPVPSSSRPHNARLAPPPPAASGRPVAHACTRLPRRAHAHRSLALPRASRRGSGHELERVPGSLRDAYAVDAATTAPTTTSSQPSLSLLVALASTAAASLLATPTPVSAAGLSYDPAAGSDFLKNVAGAAYVVLLVIFAARLLRRRAKTATSTRLASAASTAPPPSRRREVARATPARAAWAATQAGACALALYALCVAVDAFFEGKTLPDGYSARNIAVTLRTIGRGLAYLLTFIFAANAVGLAGLAVQLVFYPEPEDLYAADPASGEEGGGAAGEEGSGQPAGDGQGPPPPAAPS